MGNLRVGVIGAGYFAQFHHDAWKRLDRADLIAVADHDLGRAEAVGVQAFSDAAEMLRQVAPDIVDIATPPDSHADMISLALAQKPRAIICQKPFCGGDLALSRKLADQAVAAGVRLIVHENFRFQPWYRRLKQELEAGRVGTVHQLSFRLRPGDGQGPDAYLARQPYFQTMPRFLIHETGIHWVDTFRYLLGEPEWVSADLRRLNPAIAGEDAGSFLFGYADGRRALFDGNRLLDHAAEDCRRTMGEASLEGEAGQIKLFGDGSLRLRQRGEIDDTEIAAPPAAVGFGGDCLLALQAHVVAHLLDATPVENDAASYLRNQEIVEAIYRSAETGMRCPV